MARIRCWTLVCGLMAAWANAATAQITTSTTLLVATPSILVTLNQSTLFWGQSTTGTVTLGTASTDPNGTVVVFTSPDPRVSFAESRVTVPSGQKTATFTVKTSAGTTTSANLMLDAYIDGTSYHASYPLNLEPITFTIALSPSVVGGTWARGTLYMRNNLPAPMTFPVFFAAGTPDPGGNQYLVPPATLYVQAGQASASFFVGTKPVSFGSPSASALLAVGGAGFFTSAGISITPVKVQAVTVGVPSVIGGQEVTGTVFLDAPAPAGGLTIPLNVAYSLPTAPLAATVVGGSVSVAAGTSSGTFRIATAAVTQDVDATFSVSGYPGAGVLKVKPTPALAAVTLASPSLFWGQSTTGSVTLNTSAPAAGVIADLVPLSASDGITVTPSQLVFSAGTISRTFQVTTAATSTLDEITRSVQWSTHGTTPDQAASLSMKSVKIAGVALSTTTALPGSTLTGTVNLTAAAVVDMPVQVTATVRSGDLAAVLPAIPSLVVPAGQRSSAAFTFTSPFVRTASQVSFIAQYTNGAPTGAPLPGVLTINPTAVTDLQFGTSSVTGNTGPYAVSVTPVLNAPAPAGGATIALLASVASGCVGQLSLPASAVIPEGQTRTSVTMSVGSIKANCDLGVTARYAATATQVARTLPVVYASGTLSTTSTTPTLATVSLSSLTVAPSSVTSGSSFTVTATLTSAPVGFPVSLPLTGLNATITIAAGTTTGSFTAPAPKVAGATTFTIGASYGGASRTASVLVSP